MTRANAPREGRRRKRRELPYTDAWVVRRLRELYRAGRIIGDAAAHLYKTLATHIRPRRFETDDIVVRELIEEMHMPPSTLRRARHVLEELGDVKLTGGGQGSPTWRVAFLRMGGPVVMAACNDTEPPDGSKPRSQRAKFDPNLAQGERSSDQPRSQRAKFDPNLAQGERSSDPNLAQGERSSDQPRSQRAKFDDEHYSSDVLEEEEASSSNDDNDDDDVVVFREWYAHEYPQWHYGAPAPRITEQRQAYAEELLEAMPLRRVQLICLVAFVITREAGSIRPHRPGESEDDRMFVARSDHSLTVIHDKAPFLVREVIERGLEGSDQTIDAIADALRQQVQDAERAASSGQPLHEAHWPAVYARLPQLGLTDEEIQFVAPFRLDKVLESSTHRRGDRTVRVVVPTWQHYDALERKPLAARFESVKEAFEAAVCGELRALEVRHVRYRSEQPESGDVGEAQAGGAAR